MKHYAKTNWYEFDQLNPRYRRCYGGSAESLAETKRIYRGRERAALSRMVDELVVEELRSMEIERLEAEIERLENECLDAEFERMTAWSPEVEQLSDDLHSEYWAAYDEMAALSR